MTLTAENLIEINKWITEYNQRENHLNTDAIEFKDWAKEIFDKIIKDQVEVEGNDLP